MQGCPLVINDSCVFFQCQRRGLLYGSYMAKPPGENVGISTGDRTCLLLLVRRMRQRWATTTGRALCVLVVWFNSWSVKERHGSNTATYTVHCVVILLKQWHYSGNERRVTAIKGAEVTGSSLGLEEREPHPLDRELYFSLQARTAVELEKTAVSAHTVILKSRVPTSNYEKWTFFYLKVQEQ